MLELILILFVLCILYTNRYKKTDLYGERPVQPTRSFFFKREEQIRISKEHKEFNFEDFEIYA